MSNLKKYIQKRKKDDTEFAKDFESGYEEFKIGEMLKQARVEVYQCPGCFTPKRIVKIHSLRYSYKSLLKRDSSATDYNLFL